MREIERNSLWRAVREKQPMIHAISNLVTANDCANLLLAVGARPIMAQEPQEAAEITAACDATVLNLGTPNDEKFCACRAAGVQGNLLEHPLVVDPVGVGASAYRRRQTAALFAEIRPTILRANLREVQALANSPENNWGVDSPAHIAQEGRSLAKWLARQMNCVILLTGEEDYVTDGLQEARIGGGHPKIRLITGAGCMLSTLCGALATVTDPMTAACAAAESWKYCAEKAAEYIGDRGGAGAFHMALLDAAGLL